MFFPFETNLIWNMIYKFRNGSWLELFFILLARFLRLNTIFKRPPLELFCCCSFEICFGIIIIFGSICWNQCAIFENGFNGNLLSIYCSIHYNFQNKQKQVSRAHLRKFLWISTARQHFASFSNFLIELKLFSWSINIKRRILLNSLGQLLNLNYLIKTKNIKF